MIIVRVVSGDSFDGRYSVERIFTRNLTETLGNYWLTPDMQVMMILYDDEDEIDDEKDDDEDILNNWLIPDMQEGDVKEFILDLAQTISINRKDELYSK